MGEEWWKILSSGMIQSERFTPNSLSVSSELLGKGEGHKWTVKQARMVGGTSVQLGMTLRASEIPGTAEALWSAMGCVVSPQNSYVEAPLPTSECDCMWRKGL